MACAHGGTSRHPALFFTDTVSHAPHIYLHGKLHTKHIMCQYIATLYMSIHNFVAWMDSAERNVHCRHASCLAFNTFHIQSVFTIRYDCNEIVINIRVGLAEKDFSWGEFSSRDSNVPNQFEKTYSFRASQYYLNTVI